ncbi:hypothetical protein [Alteribacillus sp. HJP-4]|uniref:hypothetical protein n=1 Tax=Alteribacillus sp. HJP-4 TaxID=2775394 RepID=UPI0035CD1356
MGYYPPPHGRPRPPYCPPKHHKKRPRWQPLWLRKCKYALLQIMLPIILFQLFRTLIFPTSFDVILLILIVCFYLYCFFS